MKQFGAAISSRFIPPKLFAIFFIELIILYEQYIHTIYRYLEICDYIYNWKVLGKVKINSENLELYCYRDKYIFSGNVKINEYDLWINVADSIYSIKIDHLKDFSCNNLYHLIVDGGKIYLEDLEITDYLESHDKIINEKIDNIIKKYNNI